MRRRDRPFLTFCRTFTYGTANRLTSVLDNGVISQYAYNGDGDRVSQTVGGVTTGYVIDPVGLTQVLAETTAGQSTFYVPGLAQYGVTGWQYFGQDRLGSVRTLLDPTGELLLARNYDPFGNLLAQGGVGQSVFGYTGEQVDSTELVYLRARYYAPSVGRFLTPDPIIPDPLRSQSWNRYAYVENNPTNYIDPSGYSFRPICVFGKDSQTGRCKTLLPPGFGAALSTPATNPAQAAIQAAFLSAYFAYHITIGNTPSAFRLPGFALLPPGEYSQDTTYPVGNECAEPGLLSGAPPVELPSFFPGPILEVPRLNTTLEFPLLQPGETGSNILFIERKQALKIMKGLSIQIEIHLRKIANEPDSQAAEHWRSEVDNWINDIERLSAHVGKKTQAEWAEVIENWRSRLGD